MRKKVIIDGTIFNYYIYDDGRCQNIHTGKFLKGSVSNGYHYYYLRNGKKKKRISVHRLVALSFLDNFENLDVVHHKDGNKLNNNVENLQWVTSSDNARAIGEVKSRRNKRPKHEYFTSSLEGEKWAQYKGTNYYFSNYGRLRNMLNNRLLKMHSDKSGYCFYTLTIKGRTTKVLAHRGVYESFNQINLSRDQQIDHIDANRSNNSLSNLRVVTAKENSLYRSERLNKEYFYVIGQFDLQGNFINYYLNQSRAAEAIGVSPAAISNVINGKCPTAKHFIWKKISKEEVQRLSVMDLAEQDLQSEMKNS